MDDYAIQTIKSCIVSEVKPKSSTLGRGEASDAASQAAAAQAVRAAEAETANVMRQVRAAEAETANVMRAVLAEEAILRATRAENNELRHRLVWGSAIPA